MNDRAIFFNKLRLQSQKFLHSHSSAEQKPNAQAHAVIGQHLHQVRDFRCGEGFLAFCSAGCPHLFSKPNRVAAHKVIGLCLLKDLVAVSYTHLANEAKSTMEEELMSILKPETGYYVYSASEWLEEMNKRINMVIVILTGIASISLLVGGIGIMNIMLVSVTERTREIGIRKALGAKERTILAQFVVEAATTSALGGVLGIALGYAVSMAANKVLPMFMTDTTVTVSPSFNSIVVAFGISVGIGVLFGYLPARRAARLNPIEALRYD